MSIFKIELRQFNHLSAVNILADSIMLQNESDHSIENESDNEFEVKFVSSVIVSHANVVAPIEHLNVHDDEYL